MMNVELSLYRPGWTSDDLHAYRHLHWCGIKEDYFERTRGMAGKLGRAIEKKRRGR